MVGLYGPFVSAQSPTLIEGLSIERVLYVQRMERSEGFTYEGYACPGHRLNVTERGRVRVECSGQTYRLGRGEALWYYELEQARLAVLEAPWVFYTITFVAPSLPPPNAIHRQIRLPRIELLGQFKLLLEQWRDTFVSPIVRTLRVQGTLSSILSELVTPSQQDIHFDKETSAWWQVEAELRKDLRRTIDMQLMCQIARCSPATITRSCRRAVGVSPLRRLKQIRLAMAHGLVILSNLTISEIADRVGYARVHELSRDYHKHFGLTPTENRQQYPQVYEREFGLPLKTDRE